jgi:hypothetical protein
VKKKLALALGVEIKAPMVLAKEDLMLIDL